MPVRTDPCDSLGGWPNLAIDEFLLRDLIDLRDRLLGKSI